MNHEGIGLGLMIVKQIVEKSNGKITVSSEGPGKGSNFSFNMKMNSLTQSIHANSDPPRLLVDDESVEALNMEFEFIKTEKQKKRKGKGYQSYAGKEPIFSTTQVGSNKNSGQESADLLLSMTDGQGALPDSKAITAIKKSKTMMKTPHKTNALIDENDSLVEDFSDMKSVRSSSSRAIMKHYSDNFDGDNNNQRESDMVATKHPFEAA